VCTYLDGEAFTWWQSYNAAISVPDWDALRTCLFRRSNLLNNVQAARKMLHGWRPLKGVGRFSKSSLSIVMEFPDITESEKFDRHIHGLKRSIWEPLCVSFMTDAIRIEAAKAGTFRSSGCCASNTAILADSGVAPMDLSIIKAYRMLSEKPQSCMCEGLCLRCREKGHLAKECPKGQQN